MPVSSRVFSLSHLACLSWGWEGTKGEYFNLCPGREDDCERTCRWFPAREPLGTWFCFYEARLQSASLQRELETAVCIRILES